jgi:alanine racemase
MSAADHNETCFASSIAEISWKAFSSNWKIISSKLKKGTGILPMVKTNAYGHDLGIISSYCEKLGAVGLGLANIFEAIELRSLGYENRIINFGKLNKETLDAAYEFKITIVIHHLEDLALLSSFRKPLTFHLEIETGMNRLGINAEATPQILKLLLQTPHKFEGAFTHLVESEVANSDYTTQQLKKFEEVISVLRSKYGKPFITHVDNSGGVLNRKTHYDWVRPGISLYGYHPNSTATDHKLMPVLTWNTSIMQINQIKAGDFVSYNRSFEAKKDMTIATIPVGYGDGLARNYKSLEIGYKGKRCPILGNICMDLMMIDISEVSKPKIGDIVYLLGYGRNQEPSAWDYAKVDRTIPYEVLTRISPRVLRIQAP